MLLDPVNSITSVSFYRKVSQQSLWRTLFYLPYLALILAAGATFATKTRVMPMVLETMDWLAKSVPSLTFKDGKVSTPAPGPYTLRHPSAPELGVIIDTARTEPVTPLIMDQNKAIVYLTGGTLYLMREPGRVEVYDLSKTQSPQPVVIDSKFYEAARESLWIVIYPATFFMSFFLFLAWKCASAFGYSLLGLILNAIVEGGLEYPPLFNIAVYAQTLAVVLQAMYLFITPLGIGLFRVAVLSSTGIYLWLAIKANSKAAQDQSPAAQ